MANSIYPTTTLPLTLIFANAIGTFLEYFDYTIYAFSASTIAQLFFPSANHTVALLFTWAVFAISFIIRPFGAMFFAHWGDRYGRRQVLTWASLLMAIPTISIGLLPTYQTAGILAPFLLLLCRMLQGFAVSADYNGASTYLFEFAARGRGLRTGFITCACGVGMLSASLTVLIFHHDWRYPFLLAGILIGTLGAYLRHHLPETPEFTTAQAENRLLRYPLLKLLQQSRKAFGIALLLSVYDGVASYILLVYIATYLNIYLSLPQTTTLWVTAMVACVEAIASPGFGWLSDRYSRKKLLQHAAIAMTIFAIPLFWLVNHGSFSIMLIALLLLAIIFAAFDGPLCALLADLFQPAMRLSGTTVSYSLGAGIIGGFTPLVLTLLIHTTGILLIPGLFLAGSGLIAVLPLWTTDTLKPALCQFQNFGE